MGGILAKKPTGGLTRGEKKKINRKIGKKNILEDLPGGGRGDNEKILNTEKKQPEKVLLKE